MALDPRTPSATPASDADGLNPSASDPVQRPLRALVTGGSGNLGRAVVSALLRRGDHVHVPLWSPEEGAALTAVLQALEPELPGVRARLFVHEGIDLSRASGAERLFTAFDEIEKGGPDAVLHLAGGFHFAPIAETDPDDWQRMHDMNTTSAFLTAREAFPRMVTQGGGRIVMVSALPVLERGRAGMSAYAAAKAGVLSLVETLAREGAPHGITVNAILPSIIDTPTNREAMPDADFSQWVSPDEIAAVLSFLISPAAGVVTGAAIPLQRS